MLNAGLDKKLTLVSAPAGFGKTTLIADWHEQIDLPAAWLSLDEADNDLLRFLAYLAAAFQQVDEAIGASLLSALQSAQPPPLKKLLTALLNEITHPVDPLVLVLDDFHQLSVEQALYFADLALDRVNADEALCDRVAGHAASIRAFLIREPSLLKQ
jgi:LuxR family maltose regulon positive regulatory protein